MERFGPVGARCLHWGERKESCLLILTDDATTLTKHRSKSSQVYILLITCQFETRMKCFNKKEQNRNIFISGLKHLTPLYLKNTDVKLWHVLCILHALHSFSYSMTFFSVIMSNCSLTWNANLSSIPLIHHCMHIQLNIFNIPCTSPKVPPCSWYIIFIFTFCVLNKDVLDVTYNHCNHTICSNLFAAYILKACIQFQNDFFCGKTVIYIVEQKQRLYPKSLPIPSNSALFMQSYVAW